MSSPERADDGGFTLIELVIVTAIMVVVLVMASSGLVSLSNGANRDTAVVQEEQQASTELTQMARDIRSAHALVIPSGFTVSNQIELQVNSGAGSCSLPGPPASKYALVEWIYQPSATPTSSTLKREVLTCTGASVQSTAWILKRVANGSSNPMFKYFNQYGNNISTALPGAIAACTTRIGIDLLVGSVTTTVVPFETKQSVALTDQVVALSQPGNGQC